MDLRVDDLVNLLQQIEINAVIPPRPDNVADKLLVIRDYASSRCMNSICVALSLSHFPEFPRKMWISVPPSNIKNPGPSYNEGYQRFDCDGVDYYPYSVNLSDYDCSPASIKELLENIYHKHVIFGEPPNG